MKISKALAKRIISGVLPPGAKLRQDHIAEGDSATDVKSWEEANRAFHRLILYPCQMPRLLRSIDELQATSARFLFSGWRPPIVTIKHSLGRCDLVKSTRRRPSLHGMFNGSDRGARSISDPD